jgi:hypothetical protein
VIVLGSAPGKTEVLFNGEPQPDVQLEAGKTYRLRLVQIMTTRPAMYVALVDNADKPEQWTLVAKDGADLPAHQVRTGVARQPMANGETYDVLFTPRTAGTWRLEARANNATTAFAHMTLTAR